MSADRVDKTWHTKGIETYSTAAILGSLSHYGAPVTEAAFLELSKEEFPLTIAMGWHETWKGTGQFSRFPGAAAEELWRRLKGGEIAPTDLSLAMVNLLASLNEAIDQKKNNTWDAMFDAADGCLKRVTATGDRREKFMAEMVGALGEWLNVLDGIAEALATKGHHALADRFVVLEETLFPVRQGTATALVTAAKGDAFNALIALRLIAGDAKRDDFARLSAIDALFHLEQLDDAKAYTLELMEIAEQKNDVDLASETVERLAELMRLNPKRADRDELRERVEKLSKTLEAKT